MSKMTIAGIKAAMASYVAAAKQAGQWTASTDNFVGMLDKVGKQVTIDGDFQDKLPELDGNDLPYGKTIEEYYIDLTLPEAMTGNNAVEGAKDTVPALPSVEDVAYSYSLGREKIKTTIPYDNFERAMLGAEEAGNMAAKITERLENSYSLTKYAEKKQLLGNAADKAVAAGCVVDIAKPVDTATAEALIKQIKEDVETASFAHEGGLEGALIGAAPELTFYAIKGIMPTVEVDALAGAFHSENLALPCKIKVVDDFGVMENSGVYGILVDTRGVKLHKGYTATRSAPNADGDFLNIVRHFEHTGFISKFVNIVAYRQPQE